MKKRLNFETRAFGAEEDVPSISELADWTGKQHGTDADLISFLLERSLAVQEAVTTACAGGCYYGDRWLGSILGLRDRVLTAEPDIDASWVIKDARRIHALRQHAWCALPGPSSLGIEDRHFGDTADFYDALCHVFARLMREMRDSGVAGHVLIGDGFTSIELEDLAGKKVFFFAPGGTGRTIERILEVQDSVAVPARFLPQLLHLMGEYDVRRVALIDAGPEDYAAATGHFDPENIYAGGYCTGGCAAYWKEMGERAWTLQE
ncbi:MAG: hypothetical protein APR53_06895 [Methanoculleus sp. SDB]|nr:MAG: hypothetical protein APR53_06895 [Methanoculleus sp. SDB]